MDLAATHALRREMYLLLEQRQEAESRVMQDLKRAVATFYRELVDELATWLFRYAPDTRAEDPDRKIVEAATAMSIEVWIGLRKALSEHDPRQEGWATWARYQAGYGGRAEAERKMDEFLLSLAKKVLAEPSSVRGTSLEEPVLGALRRLDAEFSRLWTQHVSQEQEAAATLRARSAELANRLAESAVPALAARRNEP